MVRDARYHLWRTDGTAAGTTPVTTLGTPQTNQTPLPMASDGRSLFFNAPDLYVSDGTAGNTRRLSTRTLELIEFGGRVYGSTGSELRLLSATGVTSLDIATSINLLQVHENRLYFRKTQGGIPNQFEEWRSTDGGVIASYPGRPAPLGSDRGALITYEYTLNGVSVYRDSSPHFQLSSFPQMQFTSGSNVFFSTSVDWSCYAAATRRIEPLGPPPWTGPSQSYIFKPRWWIDAGGGRILFGATDPVVGHELFVTEGTAATTRLVKDILPGRGGGETKPSNPFGFVDAGGLVYFAATETSGARKIFESDGTTGGTKVVVRALSSPVAITPLGGVLICRAQDSKGYGLFAADPVSGAITPLVRAFAEAVTRCGPFVFFLVQGVLWRTDGTFAGTRSVHTTGSTYAHPMHAHGDTLFVQGDRGGMWSVQRDGRPKQVTARSVSSFDSDGYEVRFTALRPNEWWSYHPASGTSRKIMDLGFLGGSATVESSRRFGSLTYFWTVTGGARRAHVTDGTPGGTIALPAANTTSLGAQFVMLGREVLVRDQASIWMTDGTPAGTRRIKTLWSGSSVPRHLTFTLPVGTRKAYFGGETPSGGLELWCTDGAASGSQPIGETLPGPASGLGSQATPVISNGRLFYSASDGQ